MPVERLSPKVGSIPAFHSVQQNINSLFSLVLYDLQKRFEVMHPERGHVYNKPEEDNRVTEKPHDVLST